MEQVPEVEGRRRTRSSARGVPATPPPPAKKEKKTPVKGKGYFYKYIYIGSIPLIHI